MTLSEIATLCPAPEGMEWKEPDKNQFVLVTTESGVAGSVDISNPDDDEPDAYVSLTGNGCHYQAFPALLDLPAAYLRALTAVGLAPDPEKEALRREVEELRRTVRECPTCDGGGIMGSVVGVTAPDGEEVIEDVTCAECHGTGVSSWGEALDEADRLRLEVAALRRRLTWTSEVPTTPGRYLVEDPDADGAILMYEFGVGGLGWVEYVPHTVRFGPLGFASDSRFLLLANLKET